MVEWLEVPQKVLDLVQEVLEEHHRDLRDFRIAVVFRSEAMAANGKFVLGGTTIIPAKYKTLIEYDAMIWLAQDWFVARFNDFQRRALVDQRLCALDTDDDGEKLIKRAYDVQEYHEIFERYGFWNAGLVETQQVLQPYLIEPEPEGAIATLEPEEIEKIIEVV